MIAINNYMITIFKMIHKVQVGGMLQRPLDLRITKQDKKTLRNIYKVYKIYRYKLSFRSFLRVTKDYSIRSGYNIIKAGNECAIYLEKINNN